MISVFVLLKKVYTYVNDMYVQHKTLRWEEKKERKIKGREKTLIKQKDIV